VPSIPLGYPPFRMRSARLLLLVLALGLMAAPAAVAAPAITVEAQAAAEAAVTAAPAVEFDPNPAAEEEVPAWTYRFLIPTFIAITILLVVGTVVQYFNKVVRARYEPVE
jgi:hypothetical protein